MHRGQVSEAVAMPHSEDGVSLGQFQRRGGAALTRCRRYKPQEETGPQAVPDRCDMVHRLVGQECRGGYAQTGVVTQAIHPRRATTHQAGTRDP
jgi:hypothetical protein